MPGAAHTRVRINGLIGPVGQAYEIFSYGFNMSGPDLATATQLNTTGLVAAVTTYHHDDLALAGEARVTEIALSSVDAGGKQVGDTRRLAVNIPGRTTFVYPPQVALKVSLGSGARGKSERGGWFLPCPSYNANPSTGLIPLDGAQAVADASSRFISAVNAWGVSQLTVSGGPNPNVVIASGVTGLHTVRVVRVGRALDTIRSRRNQLLEAYVLAAPQPTVNA